VSNIANRQVTIRRFFDGKLGAYQISDFPDQAPDGETDLLRRTGFITNIEVFANEGRLLALELGETELGIQIETVGLDWEHAVANYNGILVPGQPEKVSDPLVQAAIDALDVKTEALVDRLNKISISNPQRSKSLLEEAEKRRSC
jgi:hypothetical protein